MLEAFSQGRGCCVEVEGLLSMDCVVWKLKRVKKRKIEYREGRR